MDEMVDLTGGLAERFDLGGHTGQKALMTASRSGANITDYRKGIRNTQTKGAQVHIFLKSLHSPQDNSCYRGKA
ncbi:hypothetical protein O3P69_004305 [Scylla paramamosain]|uniref:Uncharacterized protein n=1 Tax=Scylla paramamosain TaxID=85552 RepID=A0AAW0UIX7_SCYPA